MSETVSYIMASKNAALYIRAAIESALAQTHAAIEVIVVDDHSNDTSRSIVDAYARSDSRVKIFDNEGVGVSAARNRAIAAATGDWLAILDADDLIHPRRTEHLLALAHANHADIVADNLVRFFSDRPDIRPDVLVNDAAWDAERTISLTDYQAAALDSSPLPALGILKPLMRNSARFAPQLRYREDLRIGEDQDLYARLLNAGAHFHYTPTAYYFYRKHVESTSHRLARRDIDAMEKAERDFLSEIDPAHHNARALSLSREAELQTQGRASSALAALREKNIASAVSALGGDIRAYYKVAQSLSEAAAKRLHFRPNSRARSAVAAAHQTEIDRAFRIFLGEITDSGDGATAELAAMISRAFETPSESPARTPEHGHA